MIRKSSHTKIVFFLLFVNISNRIYPSRPLSHYNKKQLSRNIESRLLNHMLHSTIFLLRHQYLIPSLSNHALPRLLAFWKALLEDWPNTQHPFMCNVIPYLFVRLTYLSLDAVALFFTQVLIYFKSFSNTSVRVCIALHCILRLRLTHFVVNLEIVSCASSLSHIHDELRLPKFSSDII